MLNALTIISSTNPFESQPLIEAPIVIVSDSASDTNNLTVVGETTGAVPASEGPTAMQGQVEFKTAASWERLTALSLSSPAVGTVSVRLEGTAATGDVRADVLPTEGQTLILGVLGFARTYTYRSPGRSTIDTIAAAGITTGDYFDVSIDGVTDRFWFNVAAGGGAPGTPGGGTLTEVAVGGGDTADQVATALQVAMEAHAKWAASVSTNRVTVTAVKLGAVVYADGASATGFTHAAVEAGTASAANQIRRAYHTDGVAASLSDIADYVKKTINLDGTAGTHYGTGTTIHGHLSATVSTVTVTLTDKIGCIRSLGWETSNGTWADTLGGVVRNPTGGSNGDLIGQIGVGASSIGDSVSLDNEGLDAVPAPFPALQTPTFDAVRVGGGACRVWVKQKNEAGSSIDFEIWGGVSPTALIDTGETVSTVEATEDLVSSALLQGYEYIQVRTTTNANTVNRQVAGWVVSQN